LANPTLTTLSGRPATFLSGGEQPYPTPAAVGQPPGVEFRPFGTRLTFLPVVLSDGRIRLEVEPEVSRLDFANAISFAGTTVPQFLVQRVHATVEMSNGQTFAIGGLMQTTVDGRTDKVPCLGDTPFFGSFFRRVRYEESEQELLILVTVRLVDPMDCAQRGQTKMPGQETRTPTDFELFLEGILEAPRGQRPLCVDGQYRSAHYWAGSFCDPAPGHCGNGACAPGAGYAPAANVQQVGVTVGMPVGTRSEPTTQIAPVDAVAPAMRGSIVPPSDVQRAVTVDVEAVPTETPAVLPTEAVQKPEVAPAPMPPEPVPPQ
jgi:pilus assembly protein CpaC